ncbi:ATP-dependent helicase HrpB [Vibrio ouci]|uniref:ATP-dependent helicase HrpB n=1 Tax=Vibrio ouci TaxID=2499078 RepID=A0A4Y8WE61_9VIBR|nr:ATP-dependent helicase HrpB [Vibrio ouci]TFH91054.1 ATP-dependent helicase HrpB [Vibrio ouci]
MSQLPIQGVMPELLSGVRESSQLILKAAPGAGKSTYFPLQLLLENVVDGKIIMLEPRRLAARNIARYLASQLGENVGERIGYRVRGENKTSARTQLEVVTEGVLTRMIQSDPELSGVDLVIFDEFHERSIHADTALAFCLEIQEALRDDLKLVVMSATLDQHALAKLLPEAVFIESHGRSYPVEYRYINAKANERLEDLMAKQITSLMNSENGSLLAFLPGVAAIKRVEDRLQTLPADIQVCPLYGQLDFAQQQAAIQPATDGQRKVVLATNIAETSLTIEGIRLVVDSGLERVAKFDLKSGVTRLEQVRIAQSSAEQRAGRAGRIEAGICVRLYSEGQLNQQPYVPQAEIVHSDLSNLVLELAQWGAQNPDDLCWLDTPPAAAVNQAKSLLLQLGLIDSKGQLTEAGVLAGELGLEPRTSAMLANAGGELNTALAISALLEEPERNTLDFMHSVHRLKSAKHSKQKLVTQRAKTLAAKMKHRFELSQINESQVACLLAMAFPDRVAQARRNQLGRFILANGHGAQLQDTERLAASEYLVAIDLMRSQSDSSMIYSALELDIVQLQSQCPDLFIAIDSVDWDEKKGRLVAERQTKLGRLVIDSKALPEPSSEKMTEALLTFIQRKGLSVLNWTPASQELLERLRCGQEWLPEQSWPELDEASFLANLDAWLAPYLNGINSVKALAKVDLEAALLAYLGWPLNQDIEQWLPTHYQVPTGSKKKIRYQQGHEPVLSVRMQEVFGEQASPEIAQGRKRLVLELLSPAQRPLQVTQDLASFWAGAYKEVQKEMKGRYPKHVWPDNPATHVATTKTKRQLNS